MKILTAVSIIYFMLASNTAVGADPEYLAARSLSWQGYESLKQRLANAKGFDQTADAICRDLIGSQGFQIPIGFLQEAKTFCKLSKRHNDWFWFELPGGGSMYCASYYAVQTSDSVAKVIFQTGGCHNEYTISVINGNTIQKLDDLKLFVDGNLYSYHYNTYRNIEFLRGLGNAREMASILYAHEDRVIEQSISISGSGAAMRFLGFMD